MPEASSAAAAVRTPRLAVHRIDDPDRGEVEAFIRHVFAQRYGAELREFAPLLVSLSDEGGLLAAAGYRPAANGPLFLERYLEQPADTLLARQTGHALPRADLVEVGHLAAARPGGGRRLILLLGPHLAAQGFEWVVSTLTEELRQLFLRIGVAPLALGRAEPAALGPDAASWGRYYEHRPMVLAGQLEPALRRLQERGLVAATAAAEMAS